MGTTSRNGNATAAGVLSIIAGAIWIISMIVGVPILWMLIDAFTMDPIPIATELYIFIALIALIMSGIGVVAILGGVAATRRHRWRLALAGSILSLFCVWFLGIPSIILLISAKKAFKNTALPIESTSV